MGDNTLPVGRFFPAKGLVVDRTENSISISGNMELYGDEATPERAAIIQNAIVTTWTKTFPDGYSSKCNVRVTYRGPGTNEGPAAQIEACKMSGPSNVKMYSGRKMTLNADSPDVFTWVAAHEFGHVIGLEDKYSESIWSSIKGSFGGDRKCVVYAGYDGNLMAVHKGAIGSQNLKDVAAENAPSPYWINDDDQIRDWVNARTAIEIGQLPTVHKLKAIKVLMSGWISDDDVAAMAKICGSVTTKAESQTIQSGINLLDFTSIGQRTQMRVIYTKMP
jgi:hypothetical protein